MSTHGQSDFFLSFRDAKDNIDPNLLNLIFKFFAALHFVCLVFCNLFAAIMNLAYFNLHNP